MAGSKFQYDESGGTFFYFLLSFLALILIPASYYFWPKDVKRDKDQTKSGRKCHCELCQLKQNKLTSKEPQKKIKRRLTKLLIVIGWIVFAAIAYKVAHLERDHVDWDPFDILQIDRGASQAEIKRAYRKLSLIYHPDKDTGDPKKFLQLTKAHAALTDDEARKNWEMYGNPDGPGAMSFGIALPSWIVEKENSLWVLGLYALVFMVTLPTVVGIWWHRSIKFGEHQVLMETTRMYYYFVHRTAHMNIKRLLMILSASFEFCKHHNGEIVERPTDNFEVPSLFKNFLNFGEKNKEPPLYFAYSLKARALVFAHLSRIELNPATIAIDKMYVIKKCPFLIHEMVQSIYQMLTLSVSGHFRQMPLVETLDMLENCMRLSPMIVQALWEKKSALLQLPHIKEDMLRHFSTRTRHIRTVQNLVRMKRVDRRLLLQTLTDEEYDDVMSVCGQMPYVDMTAKAEVLGDVDPSTITVGAVVTVTVTLKRQDMSTLFEQESLENSDDKETPVNEKEEEEVEVEQKKQQHQVWRKQKKKSKGGKSNKKKVTSKQFNRKRQNPNEVKSGAQTTDEKEPSKTKRVVKDNANEDGNVSDESSKESDLDSDGNDDSNEENSKDASESDEEDDQLWKETQVIRGKKEKTMESRSRVSHIVHCPYFPEEKQEYWWIYIVDRKLRYIMTAPFHITDLVDETEVQLKFPAPDNVGIRQYTIHLRSDSYVDSDVSLILKLDVKEAKIISPEDLKYGISENEDEEDDDDNDKVLTSDDDVVAISESDTD